MTQTEALRLALEALAYINEGANNQGAHTGISWRCAANKSSEALNAIKAALEAKDEPFEYWNAVEGWVKIEEVRDHFDSVGCGTIYKTSGEDRVPLYTTPLQRKPLTDEAIATVYWGATGQSLRPQDNVLAHNFARAIEAAHGIKE